MNKKLLFALIGVFLMTSGIFSLVSYIPAGTIGVDQASPALSNVGETAGTSVVVNYWTQASVANSGTTTVDLLAAENASSTSTTFDNTASWPGSFTAGQDGKWSITENLPSMYFWTGSNANTIHASIFF